MSSGKTQEIVNVSLGLWGLWACDEWRLGERNSVGCICTENSMQKSQKYQETLNSNRNEKNEQFLVLLFLFTDSVEDKHRCPPSPPKSKSRAESQLPPSVPVVFQYAHEGLTHSECPVGPCWIWILVWIGEWTYLALNTWHSFFSFLWTLMSSLRQMLLTYLLNHVQEYIEISQE